MAPDRDDGIEEEPFEFEEEEFEIDLAEPKEKAAAGGRQGRGRVGYEEEPADEDEYDEEYEEAAPRRGREKLEAAVAGVSPKTLKLVLAGVVVFAVVLVALAVVLKKRSRKAKRRAEQQQSIDRAVGFMTELHRMGVEYFTYDGQAPAAFTTRFKPTGGDEDERRYILGAAIQRQKPGSVTFQAAAVHKNYEHSGLIEYARRKKVPLPGTSIYMTRGKATVEMVEYDVRIFRQDILDDKGNTLGRVALMMLKLK